MPEELRFDGQTVVITGAGGGLGRAYAILFGSRGANVVVNDLGGSFKGEGKSSKAADEVVKQIKDAGGKAVANYDSVEDGDAIIDTAVKTFGGVHILINNAGILRDVSFKNMKDEDWDLIFKVHVTGAYKCSKAAWPHFRKQKYGRIINTASAAGLFGSFGQCNYSAAKLAMVGFTETLAKEGLKYNIICNVIAPIAASRMTETVMPPDVLKQLTPDFVVPLVVKLVHKSNTKETGSIFEVGGGHMAKLRWERAKGLLLRPDDSMHAGTILAQWDKVKDYSTPEYPTGVADFMGLLETALKKEKNPSAEKLDFKGKVAVITGGGAGIGRAYCLLFSSLGAKVVVNDLMNPDDVVDEIKKNGGEAVPAKFSCEDGDAIIKTAIDNFGAVHILVNNAGILRDKAFTNMTPDLWDPVLATHARGTFKCTKAAWPHFLKQKYGRILNTTSTSGIYGNFGQANYAAAKLAILGLSRALALEGKKYNINVNTIAPNAGTAMTRTIMPEEMVAAFKPDYVAPLVAALCSDKLPKGDETGGLYEVGCGWQTQTRWQRSGGHGFPVDVKLTPEAVDEQWQKIVTFDERADHPSSGQDGLKSIMANASNKAGGKSEADAEEAKHDCNDDDDEQVDYLAEIEAALAAENGGTESVLTAKDTILYNLGINTPNDASHLPYLYENHDSFTLHPTYGVIPALAATPPFDITSLVPNFNPMLLLHAEMFLHISHPVPTEGTFISTTRLLDVVDKGKAALVVSGASVREKFSGREVWYAESSVFLRGSGGFGGRKEARRTRGFGGSVVPRLGEERMKRPENVKEERTREDAASLYRLNGDWNPLHIDPEFAAMAGFERPILHGLCTFGIACRLVQETYGDYSDVSCRFVGVVIPGQTLRVEMWKAEGNWVVFQVRVVETGKMAIAAAGVKLVGDRALNSKL